MTTFNDYPSSAFPDWVGEVREKYEAVVLGVPCDMTATTASGQRDAPDWIRSASRHDALDYLSQSSTDGDYADFGDVPIVTGNMKSTGNNISGCVADALEASRFTVVMGGDDGINYWVAQGLHHIAKMSPGRRVLFHFDAHADIYSNNDNSIDHATWIRDALADGYLDQVYLFGARAHGPLREPGSNITICELDKLEAYLASEEGRSAIMLGLDMDVIDPAYAPGVAVPEPFGLSPHTLLPAIEQIAAHAWLMSVTEVTPANDINGVTAMLANRLITRAISYKGRFTTQSN